MRFSTSFRNARPGGFATFFIFQGSLLILLGLLIVLFPALLRVMVATFFILIGLMVLGFGLSIRSVERGGPGSRGGFLDL
ncbi:MAG: hypothetical protein GXP58_06215 [Deltaproteobacteria bacterium]|nr:hypothetical protein [Deltaproteobacteria bacterium]